MGFKMKSKKEMNFAEKIKWVYYRLFYGFSSMRSKDAKDADNFFRLEPANGILVVSIIETGIMASLLYLLDRFVISIEFGILIKIFAIAFLLFNILLFKDKDRQAKILVRFKFEYDRIWRNLLCILFLIISVISMPVLGAIFGRP